MSVVIVGRIKGDPEKIKKVFASHKAAMDVAARGLSKVERATLIQLLKKLGMSAGARASA